jgi:hypothetical protein
MVLNADGSAGLTVHAAVSISAPMLQRLAIGLPVSGVLIGAFAAR